MQQTITHRILQRTNGRIQLLEVEVNCDTVIVRGHCPSYYIKQLALQGVLDVLAANGSLQFEHKIEVVEALSLPPQTANHPTYYSREGATNDYKDHPCTTNVR